MWRSCARPQARITFLDDARYNDATGTVLLASGDRRLFGELFRAAAWQRDERSVADKVRVEFGRRGPASEELDYFRCSGAGSTISTCSIALRCRRPCRSPRPCRGRVNYSLGQVARVGGATGCSGHQQGARRGARRERRTTVRRATAVQPGEARAGRAAETTATCQSVGVSVVASSTLAERVLSGKYRGPSPVGCVGDQLTAAFSMRRRWQSAGSDRGQACPAAAVVIADALAQPASR